MAKKVKCPKCKCVNCTPLTDKKKFSVGKGLVGGAVGAAFLGPIGLIGAASGLNGKKKVTMMCNECGAIFDIKV